MCIGYDNKHAWHDPGLPTVGAECPADTYSPGARLSRPTLNTNLRYDIKDCINQTKCAAGQRISPCDPTSLESLSRLTHGTAVYLGLGFHSPRGIFVKRTHILACFSLVIKSSRVLILVLILVLIPVLNTALAREVPLIQAIAGWGWPLTSEASLEYCRNGAS